MAYLDRTKQVQAHLISNISPMNEIGVQQQLANYCFEAFGKDGYIGVALFASDDQKFYLLADLLPIDHRLEKFNDLIKDL